MNSFVVTASAPAQDSRPDGPPWFQWAFLGVWLILASFMLYKLYRSGHFKGRR